MRLVHLAVFGPILLSRLTQLKFSGLIFTMIKQFGTGVIVATAYIHVSPTSNIHIHVNMRN